MQLNDRYYGAYISVSSSRKISFSSICLPPLYHVFTVWSVVFTDWNRLSRIIPGLFYITTKRVCFVKFPGVPSEKWSSSFLTFDKIQRIEDADSDALVFVPIYGQYIRVGRISNRNAALAIIHQQVCACYYDSWLVTSTLLLIWAIVVPCHKPCHKYSC